MRDKFVKKKVRKDRKPRDTPEDIHEWADNWFYENFGIRARSNTMFCTSEASKTKQYGELYIVFPIGNFEIIWSHRLKDLYTEWMVTKGLEFWKDYFLTSFAKTYHKGNLQKAIKSGNEIMLHCDEYYILRSISAVPVLNHFKDTLK